MNQQHRGVEFQNAVVVNHQRSAIGIAQMQTFMAWVKWNGGGVWQRIFDFGNDTTHYALLTPSAANGKLRYTITVNSTGGEQFADAPSPLPIGVWTHVAMTTDGSRVILYTNADVISFVSSGVISDNFEVNWDRTKFHYPVAEPTAEDGFVSYNYVIRLKDDRLALPELRQAGKMHPKCKHTQHRQCENCDEELKLKQ